VRRVSPEEMNRLAAEVAVERLVEDRGIALARDPDGLVGACPLCDDADGLVVDGAENTWSCRACGEGGGPVGWVMATEGVSRAHAVELLREGLPEVSVGRRPPKVGSRALLSAPFEPDSSDEDLLEQVVGFYHRTLREAPQPAAYLERRRLADSEMVEVFRLGFANRTLGYRLPERNRAAGKVLRTQLQDLGVLSGKGHEAYDGSLVVPVTDADGRVAQLYGRKIGQGLRKGTRLHTWLASPARPLFNPAALEVGGEVVLAGSVIDALTLWCAGFRHTVGVDGVEGFDDTHLVALADAGVKTVRVAYRRDDPGERAAQATAGVLLGAGIECLRVEWPWGHDANDYACVSADPTGALGKVLRSASWMGKGTAPKSKRRGRQPSVSPAVGVAPEADTTEELPVSPELAALDEADEVDANTDPAGVVAVEPGVVLGGDGMRVAFGDRCWRVRGLERNTSFDVLKVQVMVSVPAAERGVGFHIDSFDLYSARARATFVRDAADEVGVEDTVLKRDLGRVLMAAEALVEEAIRRAQEPDDTAVTLDADERAAALELLGDPKLVERICDDFARVGMVGEATNCLVGYLATVSRLLDKPLAVIVQSTSAAGKSALQDAVMDFVPAVSWCVTAR
jgi:DNA primase